MAGSLLWSYPYHMRNQLFLCATDRAGMAHSFEIRVPSMNTAFFNANMSFNLVDAPATRPVRR